MDSLGPLATRAASGIPEFDALLAKAEVRLSPAASSAWMTLDSLSPAWRTTQHA